jgi:hypothetical protein
MQQIVQMLAKLQASHALEPEEGGSRQIGNVGKNERR